MKKLTLLIVLLILTLANVYSQAQKNVEIKVIYNGFYENDEHYKMSVIIELRDGSSLVESEIIAQKSVIIKSDCKAEIDFAEVADGDYWLLVRASGFMPVATPNKLTLSAEGIEYDFTTSSDKSVSGTNAMSNVDGLWQVRPGDLDGDRSIGAFDVNALLPHLGRSVATGIPSNDLMLVLSAPVLQSPTDGATEQLVDITFDWETVSNAETYHLQISTINDFSVTYADEEGIDATEFDVTGLDYETEYFWRVKALSGETESDWSEVWSFETEGEFETVVIGEQEWMQYNLDVTHYRNGDEIPQVQDRTEWTNLTTGAWCYYENDSDNGETYGKLYNWYAVIDERGLAPEGWRVPSHNDWKELEMELGMSQSEADSWGWRGSPVGAKLAGDYDLWLDGDLRNHSEFNSSSFSGLPGGYRNHLGYFYHISYYAYWWSSMEYSSTSSVFRYLTYNGTGVYSFDYFKRSGFSVRCVRD